MKRKKSFKKKPAKRRGNPENLIVPSSELARENGIKGGIQKGINTKKRKLFAETIREFLDMPVSLNSSTKLHAGIRKIYPGIKLKEIPTRDLMVLAQIRKAIMHGDLSAFAALRDTIGEQPVAKQKLLGDDDEPLNVKHTVSTKELKHVAKAINAAL